MIALLTMMKVGELGLKIKDYMTHLINFKEYRHFKTIDLSNMKEKEETLFIAYNPSLEYIDTVFLQMTGRKLDKVRIY